MANRKQSVDWYTGFQKWIAEPSPLDAWLYRGQAASYESVVPSFLREHHRSLYRVQLYDLDFDIARQLFSQSPVFHPGGLHEDVIADSSRQELEQFSYDLLGGPPTHDPSLSFVEVVRALAQHYGFPTLFIDVSLSPVVAGFFATYAYTEDGYIVRDTEPSIVYRWPVRRISASRMKIFAAGEELSGAQEIQAIDLSNINRYMMRPRNQQAVLATPVRDPRPLYQPMRSAVDQLELTDLAQLPCCERFELPPGAGHELTQREGVTPAALFPDRIDLGNSYLAMIALMSLAVHHPESTAPATPPATATDSLDDLLEKRHLQGLQAARCVLDRECLRLVEGCPVPVTFHDQSLAEARLTIETCVEVASQAIPLIGGPENAQAREAWRLAREGTVNTEAARRFAIWRQAVLDTPGVDPNSLGEAPQYQVTFADNVDWAGPELKRRAGLVSQIAGEADLVAGYALAAPDRYDGMLDAMPSDARYEAEIRRLVAARRRWMPDQPLFPATDEFLES